MELIVENGVVTGATDTLNIVKTKAPRGSTYNRRFRIPSEIFKALYKEWITGLKIYLYKKDENDKYIYMSADPIDDSYTFSLLRQNKKSMTVAMNINKNMEYLEPNYINKTQVVFIADKTGFKFFFR